MRYFYIFILSALTFGIFLFLLFFTVKGNYFWENKEEGLVYFIPAWSMILGGSCCRICFKYDKLKKEYIHAGKEDQWNEYKIYLVVKYSYLIAKVSLLALPVALMDFFFKDGEVLGTNIPWLCFLSIIGGISAVVYIITKRKIRI
ncbi:MAG: hypothetical protein RR202_00015 [Bacteroidales bacterium]